MMRGLDETKKGLECPIRSSAGRCNWRCSECSLYINGYGIEELYKDALGHIKQLEARNNVLYYTVIGVMHFVDKWLNEIPPYDIEKDPTGEIAVNRSAEARRVALGAIEQLESERNALMHWAKGRCDTCAHKGDCVKHDPDPEGYVMRWYDDCEIWEWCGVQKEG